MGRRFGRQQGVGVVADAVEDQDAGVVGPVPSEPLGVDDGRAGGAPKEKARPGR